MKHPGVIKMKTNYILLISFMVLLIFTSCELNSVESSDNISNQDSIEIFTIKSNGEFDEDFCVKSGLKDKVIMLESKYCGHCQTTKPVFLEACHEYDVTPIMLDLSVPEDREIMESYNLQAVYTPTFIFGCKHYVGAKDKDAYLELLSTFEGDKNE